MAEFIKVEEAVKLTEGTGGLDVDEWRETLERYKLTE